MLKIFTNFTIIIIKFLIQLIEIIEYKNLSLDEDDINKKILNSINVSGFKVKTDTGYEKLTDLHLTQPYKHYILKTDNFMLSCADNHIVFDRDYHEVFVKDLKIGDLICTESGLERVKYLKLDNFKSSMFDSSLCFHFSMIPTFTISKVSFFLHFVKGLA